MPFGLTNVPSTFHALMKSIFQEQLRKFVLVFFDDVLIYSPSWDSHQIHLRIVLDILLCNQLFLKRSKCCFAQREVAYLGHVISHAGVRVN